MIEPYKIIYKEAIEAMNRKRLPKYDFLYKILDDALYNGRNRSERIVFEWLSPEEQIAAKTEEIASIKSIKFS